LQLHEALDGKDDVEVLLGQQPEPLALHNIIKEANMG
jgi:hypothetical protein